MLKKCKRLKKKKKKGAAMLQAEGVQHLSMCMYLRSVCPTRHTVSTCFSRRMDRY